MHRYRLLITPPAKAYLGANLSMSATCVYTALRVGSSAFTPPAHRAYTPYEGLDLCNQSNRKLAGNWREATPHFFLFFFYESFRKLNNNVQM